MITTFRWLLRIFSGLILLFLCAILLTYYFSSRSLPNYNAEYELSGTKGPIEIVRDNRAVPHIFAKDDNDIFFGLGFAHAQDRLWQMTLTRRTAQGRLSEQFGEETVEIDTFMRRLDIYNLAKTSFEVQSPRAKTALKAYSDGVNAWLRTVQKDALGRGAPEFFLFKPEIAPWSPIDSLAILKLMAVQSSNQMELDILRARTSLAVGADLLRDIMPDDPAIGTYNMPAYATLFGRDSLKLAGLSPRHELHPVPKRGLGTASNVWAAMGKRTAAKSSILAADPHVGLTAPGFWMLARMELQNGGIIGATVPGLPLIMSGRSSQIGWGVAASHLDDLDVYVEEINPANSSEYRTEKGYKPFRTKRVIVNIKDKPSITLDLKWTENGPIIPKESFGLSQVTPRGYVPSIHSTALEAKDTSFNALFNMMQARSAKQARAFMGLHIAPSYNLVVADPDNVVLQLVGRVPRRSEAHIGQGRIPAQGWPSRNQWNGYFPYSSNPSSINPESGIVANTNNKITSDPFPNHISNEWGDSFRFARLTKMMNERKIHTRDSFMEAQLDTISFAARATLPLVAKELWFTSEAASPGTKEALRQSALDLLANWNGEMNEHLPEPLIYTAWMRHLQIHLIRDELGPLTEEFKRFDPLFVERVMRDVDGAAVWCDIRQSTRIETCKDIAQRALDAALLELEERFGNRIESWRWGQVHRATHDHTVLGKIPLLKWVTNIRQSTSGGDHTLMRGMIGNDGPNPYRNIHGAGFRALIDFADLESSLFITSTGQSGHPLSRHYDDLAQLWRRGEYIPMVLDQQLARAGAVGITTIVPNPSN